MKRLFEACEWRQPLLYAYFACFVLAGVSGLLAPSRAIRVAVPYWGTYVWASFYLLGGLCCLASLLIRNRAGELVGLPLLSSANALYGVAILIQYSEIKDGAFLAVSALLIGQSIILADRWIGAMKLFRVIQEACEEHGR